MNRSSTVLLDPLVALGVGNDDRGDGLVAGGSDGGPVDVHQRHAPQNLVAGLDLGAEVLALELDGVHADVNEQLDSAGGS